MVFVNNGTDTVQYLFDRDLSTKFQSSGDNSDATTTTIRIDFSLPQNLSRIVLQDHNFKGFKVYYNSNSANTISPTGCATNTTVWSSNSETSHYLMFSTIASIDSIFIEATTTIDANEEKEVHQVWVNDKELILTYNPQAKDYTPKRKPQQWAHKMSDGGTVVYTVADRYSMDIRLDYVSIASADTLESLWEDHLPIVVTPFPTGTGWDGKKIYEVNWVGDFDFHKYTHDFKGLGFKGKIPLKETPK